MNKLTELLVTIPRWVPCIQDRVLWVRSLAMIETYYGRARLFTGVLGLFVFLSKLV